LAATGARTSPPAGALVVRQSDTGDGEFSTVSEAVDSLSGTTSATIFIYPGTYHEQVTITYRGPLTIFGFTTDIGTYKSNEVTITDGLNAIDDGGNDPSSTMRAEEDNFNMYNINVANSFGKGKQATALAARGNEQGFYGCNFTGYQDTLLADGGFQYYSNCYIEGAEDYIYGAASAWFGECVLASNDGGAITANSRDSTTDTSYYVIDHSFIQAASGVSDITEEVYLGRPWREFARVVFQNSQLSDIVNPKGWTTLADPAEPVYMEFDNIGDGADTSARVNETPLSAAITKTQVLGADWEEWTDTSF